MKRTAILAMLLALLMLLAACGGAKGNNGNDDEGGVEEGPSGETPDDGDGSERTPNTDGSGEASAVKVTKNENGQLAIEFQIPAAAGKEVSVLVLPNEAALQTWQNSPTQVLAIEQLTADAEGAGSITVTELKNNSRFRLPEGSGHKQASVQRCYLGIIITASGKEFVRKTK